MTGKIQPYVRLFYFFINKCKQWFIISAFGFEGSALGAYDGQAYERLLDFAKKSQFNDKEIHEGYEKYQKPYALKLKRSSKL